MSALTIGLFMLAALAAGVVGGLAGGLIVLDSMARAARRRSREP